MTQEWPSLAALELFVAVVDEGSLGAAARRVGMAQPNASRLVARLETQAGTALVQRTPRGSRPTPAGMRYAEAARELLEAARRFGETLHHDQDESRALVVGASMTVAESLLPSWLAELRRTCPGVRVEVRVLNSIQVCDQVREGLLPLGFIETPRLPLGLNATVVHEDELVVVVAPDHPWADRDTKVDLAELAHTPLVVREPGSGTREALDELLTNLTPVPPAQVLHSNAAVRVAVAANAAPAALSRLAVQHELAGGQLLQVPLTRRLTRPLSAVWSGPRRLSGAAADLVAVAGHASSTTPHVDGR